MKSLKEIFLLYKSSSPNWHLDVAHECIIDGNFGSAYEHIKSLIKEELKRFPKMNENCYLYRFVSFPPTKKGKDISDDVVIKDIREGRITLSNPMRFNDPMDPLIRVWIKLQCQTCQNHRKKRIFANLTNHAISSFRIGCFVREYENSFLEFRQNAAPFQNTLMWGHYAKCHTGVCIKYRITPEILAKYTDGDRILLFGNVRYREHKGLTGDMTLDNSLLAKSESWNYENETRLIYYTENQLDLKYRNGRVRNFVSLPGFEIKSVYMGYEISEIHKQAIKNAILGKYIDLYQMQFDLNDITKLVANKE